MASAPNFFGFRATGRARDEILNDIGYALGQVKRARCLSPDDMRIVFGLKDADMVSKYIAGENELKTIAFLRACEAWPELVELLEETTNERALKGRQRPLDLDQPVRRDRAA